MNEYTHTHNNTDTDTKIVSAGFTYINFPSHSTFNRIQILNVL